MAEPNPYAGKSRAELERQKNLIDQALAADDVRADIVAAAALRFGYTHLKKRDKLGASWESFNHQALPKEGNLAKPAGLSETEVSNIEKAVTGALERAGKG